MSRRETITSAKRWVVKIGSALLTDDGRGIDKVAIAGWVEQMAALRKQGIELVLVSSGAVAEGMTRLKWSERPQTIHELQAAAAVGQMGLVQIYESQFQRYDYHTALVLLVHDDLSDRQRYLNARGTLQTLLALNVVPVVNENDTVVTDEIRFGDNDRLAGLVANLIDADALIILTDQAGLYDADPRHNPQAQLVEELSAEDEALSAMAGGSAGSLGRGGMITKVEAARLAARSGANTVIAGGKEASVLLRIRNGENVGTLLYAKQKPLAARKQWLAGHLQTRGVLVLDDGAVNVLQDSGKSLLPVGVKSASGRFRRGEMVSCVDRHGREVARGLVNYDVQDTQKIIGCSSDKIHEILSYQDEEELIHRDNLIVL
jgi:glutamate 5-kinase